MKLFLLVLLFPMLLAGCRVNDVCVESHPAPTLTEKDNGKTMRLTAGTGVNIRLAGNPTTGYDWTFSVVEEKSAAEAPGMVVEVADGTFTPDATDRVGSPGYRTFFVRALTPGKAVLTGKYHRPWEKPEADATRVRFTLIVESTP